MDRDIAERFWRGLAEIFGRFAPESSALLAGRDRLQSRIDAWHDARKGWPHDAAAYRGFLTEMG